MTRAGLKLLFCLIIASSFALAALDRKIMADELPRLTSLSDSTLVYSVPDNPYVVLRRAGIEVVLVNNEAVDDEILPKHLAGYSGVASLKAVEHPVSLFVPSYSGLNFEHIHDGTLQERSVLFEPRKAPMELRVVDEHTVELYQAPTPHWQLESCQRYRLLEDGVLELTLECIPRHRSFINGYLGLFWASYIQRPESLDIHFLGRDDGANQPPRWIRGSSPNHGELSTHVGANDQRVFAHDAEFPLTLVFNRSRYRFAQPWYYGVSHGMAYVQIFRSRDEIRISQSPSGGRGVAWKRVCLCRLRASATTVGRPATKWKSSPKFSTSSHQAAGSSPRRSKTEGAAAGVMPRLPGAMRRAVQSSSSMYDSADMLRKPLSLQRSPVVFRCTPISSRSSSIVSGARNRSGRSAAAAELSCELEVAAACC